MKSEDIRESFLSFFAERGHYRLEGASLIPSDPTVMFTLAGMVPLKPYFTGERKPISRRLVSCQRCLRTNDIENVGKSPFHHTFFEMLGNFSIGDYFKQDAIPWAWEFLTKIVGLDPEKLLVTVYPEDDESREIWKSVGVKEDRIQNKSDNFWMMGEVGPCGPDSEIYYDWEAGEPVPFVGKEFDSDNKRFTELWNIVFTQYDAKPGGLREPLPAKNIDTGAGLERISAASQGVRSSLETDLFTPIISAISKIAPDNTDIQRRNLIADHIRACVFLVSDGVFPSNDGRGYVLKRLIRRAALAGKKIGISESFLGELAMPVVENYSKAYPFLNERKEAVVKILTNEEAQFRSTLAVGLQMLSDEIAAIKGKKGKIPGKVAFKLYDTYGFPLDLTQEIAQEEGSDVDIEGFNAELEAQRMRGRMAFTGQKEFEMATALIAFRDETGWCRFTGYDNFSGTSEVLGILTKQGSENAATEGQNAQFTVKETPFYPEKGGQIGDTGKASTETCQLEIIDTTSPVEGLILHKARITKGTLKVGQSIKLEINSERRSKIVKSHTATHLLHAGLRKFLGEHAAQAGSWVGEEELRFDFTQMGEISRDDLLSIERWVNERIFENIPLNTAEMPIAEAKKIGAVALFGEKYGDIVRVVTIPEISKELCGGCHVISTGQISFFKIISESSIGANLRRIEAKVGMKALLYVQEQEAKLFDVGELLACGQKQIKGKIEQVLDNLNDLQKKNRAMVAQMAKAEAEKVTTQAKNMGVTQVIIARSDGFDMDGVRMVADFALEPFDHGVAAIISKNGNTFVLGVISKGIPVTTLHCGKLVTKVASIVGFKGGGRPDLGQAGGIESSKFGQLTSTLETELHQILVK